MKLTKLVLIIAFTIFIIACSNQTDTNPTSSAQPSPAATQTEAAETSTPQADEFASARAIFARDCTVCHGERADGGIVTVDNLKLKVPSLKTGHALKHTDEQFARQIRNGGDGMPAFKDKLPEEQINNLVRFIRQEFQSEAQRTKEAAPAAPKS